VRTHSRQCKVLRQEFCVEKRQRVECLVSVVKKRDEREHARTEFARNLSLEGKTIFTTIAFSKKRFS